MKSYNINLPQFLLGNDLSLNNDNCKTLLSANVMPWPDKRWFQVTHILVHFLY